MASAFSRFESFGFLLLGLSSKRSYSAKPTTVNELINVMKRFSEEQCENVLSIVSTYCLEVGESLCVAKWRPLTTSIKCISCY